MKSARIVRVYAYVNIHFMFVLMLRYAYFHVRFPSIVRSRSRPMHVARVLHPAQPSQHLQSLILEPSLNIEITRTQG